MSLSELELWQRYDETELRLSAPLSVRMIELAQLRPGMNVLDLACGRGEPAIRAAQRVAPSGRVLGVDLSDAMLEMARQRAAREGVGNLELRRGNAESLNEASQFDVTLTRWGLMYFAAPVQALVAARKAMVPGGVLVAALWAEPERVDYIHLPRSVLAQLAPLPELDADVPGTFFYSELGRIERDFNAAGFEIEHVEEQYVSVMEAHDDAELIAWTRAFGTGRLLQPLPLEVQRAWELALAEAARPLRESGVVRLGGITRVVVARVGPP